MKTLFLLLCCLFFSSCKQEGAAADSSSGAVTHPIETEMLNHTWMAARAYGSGHISYTIIFSESAVYKGSRQYINYGENGGTTSTDLGSGTFNYSVVSDGVMNVIDGNSIIEWNYQLSEDKQTFELCEDSLCLAFHLADT